MKPAFETLARSSDKDLEEIFRGSKGPGLATVVGYEWKGYNTPWFTELLGIRKFIKGFFSEPKGSEKIEGYNIPVRQNGLGAEWIHKPSAEAPKRFGFYLVRPVDPASRDNRYPDALLLDYGASPRNFFCRPERVLRDYLVQPDPSDPDLLLGKAYIALGGLRVPSNFFILGRLRPVDWKP